MLNIKKAKRLKRSRNVPKIILRIVIVLAVLAVIAAAAYAGYKFYLHLNENPQVAVEYKAVDENNASSNARKYYAPVRLSVEHVPATMKPGDKTTFSFKTVPDTKCNIEMKDKDKQPYIDPKFVEKRSDKMGFVSWDWIAKDVADGSVWTVKATCSNPSHSNEVSRELEINSKPKTPEGTKSNQVTGQASQ